MEDKNSKIKGLITTILIHGILIVFLCLYTFSAPKVEFPEPNGIEVALGELVIGDDVPGTPESQTVPTPESEPSSSNDNTVVTQADGPVTIKQKDTKPTDTKPELTPEEKEKIRKQEEFMRRQQALANQNLNGNPGNNGTNSGNLGNSSTGNTSGTPGNPNGNPNVKNTKGTPGNPFGNGDATSRVSPKNTSGCSRDVVLKATIDSQGNVIKVEDYMGTTEGIQECISASKSALRQWKFPKNSTSEPRFAIIKFQFDLH